MGLLLLLFLYLRFCGPPSLFPSLLPFPYLEVSLFRSTSGYCSYLQGVFVMTTGKYLDRYQSLLTSAIDTVSSSERSLCFCFGVARELYLLRREFCFLRGATWIRGQFSLLDDCVFARPRIV
ncbi:hypothetical protein L210DRAFT_3564434 [Boletus edulis BED1]|uniref:Secreted protein n=1 Tax=Boletus edulis BED1 TaxID=1328754 RepID=A0AAD4BGW1_BOLED|nr:hypothetical protein L210DRAFT_3564434 [Boletus edulis BED1]